MYNKETAQSGERFRLLFDNIFDAVIVLDTSRTVVDVNFAACKLLGYSKDALIGLKIDDIHPEDEIDKIRNGLKLLFKNHSNYLHETALIRKNGERVFAETGAVLINLDGEDFCLGSFRDTTDRKKAEEALRASEKKYKTLTNNLNVGIFRSTGGSDDRFLEVNPAFLDIFGYDSKEALFKVNVPDLYVSSKSFRAYHREMQQAGFVSNSEFDFRKRNGSTFTGSVNAVAVRGTDGITKYYDGIVEDVSQRKQSEEALKEAFKRNKDAKGPPAE